MYHGDDFMGWLRFGLFWDNMEKGSKIHGRAVFNGGAKCWILKILRSTGRTIA